MKNVKKIADEIINLNVRGEVLEFLKANPDPTDDVVHAWAEKKGLNTEEVETEMYKLATKFANFLLGGRANEKGFSSTDADQKQLDMGIKIEYEHSPDKDVSARIVIDHLSEIPDYYTRLKKMEEDAGVKL